MKYLFLIVASLALAQASVIDSDVGISPYIVGGEDANIEDFPWMVTLYTSGNSFTCGGSIIAPNWILTAAHCLPISSIQYGATNRSATGPNKVGVAENIRHPSYVSYSRDDIALLRLSENIVYGPTAQPIKLPVNGSEVPGSWETDIIVTGWGYNSSSSFVLPITLQKVNLKVVSNQECLDIHQTKANPPRLIYDTNVCVGVLGGGKSECNGDSGSPAILLDGTQIGVCSWSIKPCANPTFPGVFTKLSHYREWIRSITGV